MPTTLARKSNATRRAHRTTLTRGALEKEWRARNGYNDMALDTSVTSYTQAEGILEHLKDDPLHKPQRLSPSSAEDHKAQQELPTCLSPTYPHSLRPSYTDLAVPHTPGPLHMLLFLPRNPPPGITGLHAPLLQVLAPQGCLPLASLLKMLFPTLHVLSSFSCLFLFRFFSLSFLSPPSFLSFPLAWP